MSEAETLALNQRQRDLTPAYTVGVTLTKPTRIHTARLSNHAAQVCNYLYHDRDSDFWQHIQISGEIREIETEIISRKMLKKIVVQGLSASSESAGLVAAEQILDAANEKVPSIPDNFFANP